jgi:hypothetical protein
MNPEFNRNMSDTINNGISLERVRWIPKSESGPGIIIQSQGNQFVPWEILKKETEELLLPLVSQITKRSTVTTASHNGQDNFVVRIIDPEGKTVGSVWFGSDPYKDWANDGLVRIGRSVHAGAPNGAEVWLITERLNDGTYRVLERFE